MRAGYATRPTHDWFSQTVPAGGMQRLGRLSHKALLTEAVGVPTTSSGVGVTLLPHKTGVNVFCTDCSARWVDDKEINYYVQLMIAQSPQPSNNLYLDDTTDPERPTGLWAALDQAR